jgi:hypothetical protein
MFLNEPKLLKSHYLLINDSKGKENKPRAKKTTYFQKTNPGDNND